VYRGAVVRTRLTEAGALLRNNDCVARVSRRRFFRNGVSYTRRAP